MLLSDIITAGADRHPERTAILFRDTRISYATLAADVYRLARGITSRGIRRGDRIAILLGNCPEVTQSYYAAAALGAVIVPANPLLKAAELAYIWADAGVKAVITAPSQLAVAEEALRAIGGARALVSTGAREETPAGITTLAELTSERSAAALPPSGADENDAAACLYTSGTTGRPKGALLSHKNLIANARQVQAALRMVAEDNMLCVLPLFHSFAATVCQNTALLSGASFTIVESFHPVRALDVIEQLRPTIFPGVPAMYGAMLQLPAERRPDLSSLRACFSGGAPMPVPVMMAFEERFGAPILEGDGPTECGPATSVNPLGGLRKPGSIGLPLPGVAMRIFDEQDREVAPDVVGEIVVRGDNVMLGYHNQPEATAEAMRAGWYHTGDLGRCDADGYFYIVDRKKDMLIVGGINVYPREIEEVLHAHPALADAAVLGAPDERRGEIPLAVVALKAGASATAKELTRHCRERLAGFKVPRKFVFRESLPRSGTGKVLKRLLRKELELEPIATSARDADA
jgi:long-chain acyl-CoA synthetase